MKLGDLVKFIDRDFAIAEETLGIVLGFHKTSGRVKVKWFKMTALCPQTSGFWPWGSLKVVCEAQKK